MSQGKVIGLREKVFRRDAGGDGWELWVAFNDQDGRAVECVGIFSKTLSFDRPFSFYDPQELSVPTLTARMQKLSSGWEVMGEYNLEYIEERGRYKFVLPEADDQQDAVESIVVPPDLDFRA